ncbi:MAG TPA: hypothetical protein VLT17_02380 [Gemmatimonadales bacterium]|nr:hypothetical protein [Gemmatimonadales bacterium]
MRQRDLVRLGLGTIGMALSIAGCSSSTSNNGGGGGTPGPDLSGNYDLVSIAQAGGAPVTPPNATGTLTLTQTSTNHGTYAVDLTIAGAPPTHVVDNGTYQQKHVNGIDSLYQVSSGALGQQVGTYTFKDNTGVGMDTLLVNVTAQGIPVTTVWFK